MTNSSRPTNGSSHAANLWASALKSAAGDQGVVLGKKRDVQEIKPYETVKRMVGKGAYVASITEIYDYSQKVFNEAAPKKQEEIASHLTTLIDLESTKLNKTIKEMNATWITALKIFMVATVVLIPVAAFVHLAQSELREGAEKELKELETRLKAKASELNNNIQDRLTFQEKKQVYMQEINDIVDVMKHKKEAKDIKLGQEGAVDILSMIVINNDSFAREAEKNCKGNVKEVASITIPAIVEDGKEVSPKKTLVLDSVVHQFHKDLARQYVVHVSEKNQDGETQPLYTNKPIEEARSTWQKEHPNEEFQTHEFVQNVVTNLNDALGDDAARWSKPIQGLCVQSSFYDTAALEVSRTNNRWDDSNGVLHELNIKHPYDFNILITRNADNPKVIEKVTISSDTPIALSHIINKKPKEVEEFDHSLTYHLSMEVTLNAQNEPQINVLRREMTQAKT